MSNEATGLSRTVYSTSDGYYRVPYLLAGKYQLRVEQAGFKALVQKGIDLSSQAALNINLTLEVGEITQSVDVTGQVPEVETTEARISQVIRTEQIRSLPAIGRGLMWLTVTAPGIQGKAEDTRNTNCCDALSSGASPALSSGGSERKAAFFVDGIAMHYGDSSGWNLAFTPNLDAVEEMRVSTNPTSAEEGVLSGVQVQVVTRGGTNTIHGTGHFTLLEDSFNAVPFGARRQAIGNWYQRFFGGTIGGPVIKNRLFFFGAYEGLRERRAAPGGSTLTVETEAFRDWVTRTRPNSVAAKLLAADPPYRYPTENLRDVNGDGVMDLGTVALDRPSNRTGSQLNVRVDYVTKSGKDRFYGTYWRTKPTQEILGLRGGNDFDRITGADLISAVHSHIFTPNSLNEFRFATLDGFNWDQKLKSGGYHLPCVLTNDGLQLGPSQLGSGCSFSLEVQNARPYDLRDTFSWNRGAHSWKFGGSYRRVYLTDPTYIGGDVPQYNFQSIIDFANDNAFQETRNVDAATGKQRDPFVEVLNSQLSFFAQNSWQVRPGLTFNFGLRWDLYGTFPMDGIQQPRNTFAPVFTSDQLTPQGIAAVRNKQVTHAFDRDWNNFGPRISVAWDPTRSGRTAIRGGFFMLYDEISSLGLYRGYYANPPIASLVNAGPQFGIPIVFGIAPVGTRDYPINPGLVGPRIDPALGIFVGTRPNITGHPQDYKQPLVYDANVAFQRQVFTDLTLTVSYHYRRTTNDQFNFDGNRFSGDLLDGRLNRINQNYGAITARANWGRRIYHGLVFEVNKRLSHGWQLNTSYSYHNGRSNFGDTEVFNPNLDWARDENATHVVKMSTVWDLPFLRTRKNLVGKVIGGWQLASIWNFESGFYFNPSSGAQYGRGGDFNADGRNADRPDLPASDVPRSFSKSQWMNGALSASVFPLPPVGTIRNGTLPRNYFVGPGYARIDASLVKRFPINERVTVQFQAQASNLLNRVNILGVSSGITSATFGRATSFYPMRAVQMSLKAIF
ncbi:MAG: TonB-dependent receptor domain-containing protein [Blastocatellia bacterium]